MSSLWCFLLLFLLMLLSIPRLLPVPRPSLLQALWMLLLRLSSAMFDGHALVFWPHCPPSPVLMMCWDMNYTPRQRDEGWDKLLSMLEVPWWI